MEYVNLYLESMYTQLQTAAKINRRSSRYEFSYTTQVLE